MKHHFFSSHFGTLRAIALLLLLPVVALAQQGGTYQLQPTVVAGGGGTSNGGNLLIEGTIGQFLAGQSNGGTYQLQTGFWFFPGASGPVCQSLTVNPTNATLPAATVGTPYSQLFTANGMGTSFSASALPPGLQLSLDGVLSGTPTQAGGYTFTVTATDVNGCPGMREYALSVGCAGGTATVSGTASICPGGSAVVAVNISGGAAPYTVTLSNGGGTRTSSTLPLLFTVSPTATTTYAVASATDVYGCAVNASGSATVTVGASAPDTNIISLPPSVSGANVSFSFTGFSTCSAVSFECKLDSGAWTPCSSPQSYSGLANGAHTFQVRAKDAAGNVDPTPATYPWNVFVANCTTAIAPVTLASASLAIPYAQAFSAIALSSTNAGPYTFSLLAGTLPPGLQLANNAGVYLLQGTPTTPGVYTFTIRAQKIGGTCEVSRTYTMTVIPTVTVLVNCVRLNADGSYTVWFGYENTTNTVVTIPVGANNYFASGAQDRGQTTTFQPGQVNNAFSVTFANAGAFTGWLVKGPDGILRSVVPSVLSPSCPQP